MPSNIEAFLEMMSAERGASRNTLDAYRRDMQDFLEHAGSDATPDDIKAYVKKLVSRGFSPRSRARKLSSIKQYFLFLYSEGIRTDNPTTSLDTPKLGTNLPKMLSKEEVGTLLSIAAQDTSPKGLKLCALLEVLYASGLRVSELVGLKLSHLQKERGALKPYMLVKGKGGKERIVPLNPPAIAALQRYLEQRPLLLKEGDTSEWLFPIYGHDGKATYLSRQRLGVMLKSLAIQAHIAPEKISPHVLRHSFASHLISNGANLKLVQELMGHSSITTTQIYTHILSDRMKTLVLEHHPLTKLAE